MFRSIFVFLLAQAPAGGPALPAEPPSVVAQRAAAEALEAQGMFGDAGDAYVKLAEMPGVNRRGVLDRAHTNYDSAYLATQNASRLCWALKIAEQVVREGEFNDQEQASYWRDTVDDDLRRLQADARTTRRANCRFDESGSPRLLVAQLTDDDFAERGTGVPATDTVEVEQQPRPLAPAARRWRAQTASGGVLTGLGLGLMGVLAGVLKLQGEHAGAMRRMSAAVKAEGRDNFTGSEWTQFNTLRDDGLRLRNAAIGVGVAGVISLSAGVALLATRKMGSRRLALQPYGGPLGGGAVFRIRF